MSLSIVVVGLLAVALGGVLVAEQRKAGDLRSDLGSARSQLEQLESEQADLVEAQQALEAELAGSRSDLESADTSVEELEGKLAGSERVREEEQAAAEDAIAEVERNLQEVVSEKEAAEELVAELMLSYSDEIEVARQTIAGVAESFLCDYGTSRASDGESLSSVTGDTLLRSFGSSDAYRNLLENDEISTAVGVFSTVGHDPYGISPEDAKAVAVSCWQQEDAQINADLYQYESVLRESVLDAACTNGADDVWDRFLDGYEDTAVFQSWRLDVGSEASRDYLNRVEDRFGGIEAFLSIPEDDLQAEADRCADRRPLISPKGSGTWNVGEEISPGTWRAYDVSDCYWARLSANGGIRDNHFGDALRISVNVLSSDGQFEVSRCTFYYLNP